MSSWDFYTTAEALLVTQTRPPNFTLPVAYDEHVAVSQSLGGRIRSEVRGPDQRRITLRWDRMGSSQLGALLTWRATYGGARAPFKVELPAALTGAGSSTKVRVRCPKGGFRYAWEAEGRYQVTIELIEDVGVGDPVSGSLGSGTVAVGAGAVTVNIAVTAANTDYTVGALTPWVDAGSWATSCTVTVKALTYFTVVFETPAPAGAHLDWEATA